MLSKREKQVMKVIYYDAVKNDGVCLLRPIDILKGISYKYEFTSDQVKNIIKELALDDYFDYEEAVKKSESTYCFTLHQKGHAFYREILSEKRAVYRKVILTVGGVIGGAILAKIVELIVK